ncbi:hypothetical protein BH11ARM2_BH11ARM2_39720 [soil metagenome]
MRRAPFIVLFSLVLLAAFGCGSDTGDGIDPNAVKKAQGDLPDLAKAAGGDWSKLSPDAQKKFLDRARGNEGAAKQMVGMMGGQAPGGGAPPAGGPTK